ncbi:uncharacterized protein LOC111263211 isoform X2 [Varroa jacobsoni]|uniref:Uncharacterized protein n=1 Tax=Varroa destructor TaxID=109461 RepID=A0A7M7K4S3_VARDE|nr:uncharacterized protein LOC111250052 isoform X2 [Varroa destructor]XP_022693849.1 uncharacterized protein LOC111263211 isoform X2 [Varroa jacobsoni]
MTQHFVSMHSAGYNELEESRLTKYNREVPSVLAPPTSFGHQPSSTTENSVPRVENRPDFKVVYVNGGDDVLINNDEATNDVRCSRGFSVASTDVDQLALQRDRKKLHSALSKLSASKKNFGKHPRRCKNLMHQCTS